ncbi:MAG TPA: 30S ribosomal protein S17 [Actinobacteria bacterium]|nr:30S ribosomal protein S17 [Actinomycetota bacterium]
MDKSAVIAVDIDRMHPLYKKSLKRTVKYQAHDEKNEVQIGDLVELVETRPLSKNKRWRITKVVEKAK